ncbi:unnamed protein product [Paramecium primaurelia]|uniref:Uncharacterized protein n=1 Tax=Paramecium primaurelia TaxID=5886 RepID=A0A8S1KRF3_PARPR|nr:unnamed protein product [Paramecium primaurelia]
MISLQKSQLILRNFLNQLNNQNILCKHQKQKKKFYYVQKLDIVAIDLKSQTIIDDNNLCPRCLAEKVDKENITLLKEAGEMKQSMKTKSQKLAKEYNLIRLNNQKQLQLQLKSFKNYIKTELEKLLQQIDQQVESIQNDIESKGKKLEIKKYDEEIQILSKKYIGLVVVRRIYQQLLLRQIYFKSLNTLNNSQISQMKQILNYFKQLQWNINKPSCQF